MMAKNRLIKLAVEEWKAGELTGEQAMFRINLVLSIKKPPSKECTKWAQNFFLDKKSEME